MRQRLDTSGLVKAVATVIREQLSKAIGGVVARLEALEQTLASMPVRKDGRDGMSGKDGAPGKDGVDGVPGVAGKDGNPGRDGVDGQPGRDGIDGKDGAPGRDGVDGKEGGPGKDGRDGVDGKDGAPGASGKDGRDGVDGKDGTPGERGEPGQLGDQGKSGDPGAPGRDGVDGKNGIDGINGKDGRDGIDGKSVSLEDVRPLIREAVEAIPQPRDGIDGKDGTDGRDGTDGKSVSADDLLPTIKQWFDALPRAADGKDGRDGVDGKSVTLDQLREMYRDIYSAEQARWALDFERRSADLIQRCIDRIPTPKDGEDGMGFDDIEMTHDGERAFTIIMVRGERRKEFTFKVPALIERGVFREGTEYERGDGVTFGGNYWIALAETKAKPGDNNADWRLAVRKGRDGKEGPKGDKGERGLPANARTQPNGVPG